MLSIISGWATTISLIFGGCCSNAITLEQITSEHPDVGAVLTFFQFLVVSLYGLPKFLIWTRLGPRFRPRQVPFLSYLAQVVLFYLVSLLNNAAFAYHIPMAVHIIFRSGGLVISMILGWIIADKRYSTIQVVSVLLVTFGVVITTLSAQISSSKAIASTDPHTYAKGIAILTLALVISGFLGLLQDWAQSKRRKTQSTHIQQGRAPAPWQESMFYLHFLALPMFLPLLPNLAVQMQALNAESPKAEVHVPIPLPEMSFNSTWENFVPPYVIPEFPIHLLPYSQGSSLLSITRTANESATSTYPLTFSLSIPHIYLPLILNTITQLLCVAGVHRLTTHVSALTVTLVLVVRKATSLIISIVGVPQTARTIRDFAFFCIEATSGWDPRTSLENVGIQISRVASGLDVGDLFRILFEGHKSTATRSPPKVNKAMMWTGAAMVMLGTVGYAIGSRWNSKSKEKMD